MQLDDETAISIAKQNGWVIGVDEDNGGNYLVLYKNDYGYTMYRNWVEKPFAENFRRKVLEPLAADLEIMQAAYDTLVDYANEIGDPYDDFADC